MDNNLIRKFWRNRPKNASKCMVCENLSFQVLFFFFFFCHRYLTAFFSTFLVLLKFNVSKTVGCVTNSTYLIIRRFLWLLILVYIVCSCLPIRILRPSRGLEEQGTKAIYYRGTRGQKFKTEGNRRPKAIWGNWEHRKPRFWFWGTRENVDFFFQENKGTGTPPPTPPPPPTPHTHTYTPG